jgi:predicted nucleic acid-binding protein
MSEHAWSETRYELTRRVRVIAKHRSLSETDEAALLATGMVVLEVSVTVMPAESYSQLETLARGRLPADPNDWPTGALALALDAGIWTEDRDFFGCGLATWTTPVLDHYLTAESS